jgi:malate dehydrogenase (oxaloacetate-decarboxylating)(NADP+)
VKLYVELGVPRDHIVMNDIHGILHADRPDLDDIRREFATTRPVTNLMEAMTGADVFLGLSAANVITPEHLRMMASSPIVFALANPDPEIAYDLAMASRPDIIMATGRSDNPNQVNNVLGFPYIFRGALDVRATEINEAMKLAAVRAIAELAKEPVPESVNKAYENNALSFGPEYLIPKPLDPRLITTISPAVARAAMESGVARRPIPNFDAYHLELEKRVGIDQRLMSRVIGRARQEPKRVVFAEADTYKILKAAQILQDEGIAIPILLGDRERIKQIIKENKIELDPNHCEIIDVVQGAGAVQPVRPAALPEAAAQGPYPARQPQADDAGPQLLRRHDGGYRRGRRPHFGPHQGIRPHHPAGPAGDRGGGGAPPRGRHVRDPEQEAAYFFADTTVNENPTADDLVEIIGLTARKVRFFDVEPRIAVLSYSNFGSNPGEIPAKAIEATQKAKRRYPDLVIDGDIQANVALNPGCCRRRTPSATWPRAAPTPSFPRPGLGQHRLQTPPGDRRGGGNRPHPDGHAQTRAHPPTGLLHPRNRQRSSHCRGRGAGKESAGAGAI